MYNDTALFEDIGGNARGGVFATTTIVTKNRIFIPVPIDLKQFFDLKGKEKKENWLTLSGS